MNATSVDNDLGHLDVFLDDRGIDDLACFLKELKGKSEDCYFFPEQSGGTGFRLSVLKTSSERVAIHQTNSMSNTQLELPGVGD